MDVTTEEPNQNYHEVPMVNEREKEEIVVTKTMFQIIRSQFNEHKFANLVFSPFFF